jgi:signal transduction histidine kinase
MCSGYHDCKILRKYFLIIVFIFIWGCKHSTPYDFSNYDKFFYYSKTLKYQKAKDYIPKTFENVGVSKELVVLNKLLFYGVQGDKSDINFQNDIDNFDEFTKCLRLLNLGYYELFFNPNKQKAFEFFFEAIELSKKIDYLPLRKFCLISMLEYYHSEIARNDKNYINYLEEFDELKTDNIDTVLSIIYQLIFQTAYVDKLDENYHNLANKLDDFESRLEVEHPLLGRIFFEKALKFELEGNWELAKDYYEKAFETSVGLPFQSYISFSSIIKIADYYKNQNDADAALNQLKKISCCLNPNDSLKDKFYISRYKSIYLKENGDYKEAYEELLKSTDAGYQLDFRKNNLDIARLQVQLETQQKELENSKLRNQIYLLLSIAVILGITGFLVNKNTTKKRLLAEQEALLKQERVDNLLKEQELVSIDAMIEGQEKERQRVANELHDDLGSLMATIKLHFDNSKMSKKDPSLQNAEKLLEEAYQKVRGMAHSKNSGVMSNQGLLPAIKKMAQVITETNALQVTVEDFGMGERLENSLELSLFRMVQELVANVIKHADATTVSIQLTQHEDNLNIIIEDNGKGFDRSKIDTGKTGMGLTTIEKRVEHLEGNFTVDSVQGKGTSILIDIPV